MPIISDGKISEDSWRLLADDNPAPNMATDRSEPVIVSLERWQRARSDFIGHNGPLGIRLRSDQAPGQIAEDFGRFDLVALEFPTMADGRAFSYARLLRERYGYEGELRAVGKVARDQLYFMQRCGFDAFEISDDENPDTVLAALSSFSVVYQPTADDRVPACKARHTAK